MINRKKLVERHFPRLSAVDSLSPLSVGNRNFAFTADITGLQTFPSSYEVPLGTQAQWGWHSTDKHNKYDLNDITFQSLETYGRSVDYPLYPNDAEKEAYHWLRQNPHRLHLGQLSFKFIKENQEEAAITDINSINQVLNLWEGTLYSDFRIEDHLVSVTTVCDPTTDQIGVRVQSTLLNEGRLQVSLRFPAPDMYSNTWEETIFPDWRNEERHHSLLALESNQSAIIERKMDEDEYQVKWRWTSGKIVQEKTHEFVLYPQVNSGELEFTIGFAETNFTSKEFLTIHESSKQYWQDFWNQGGAIDLSESTDERANELERRIVLSQFLTALHSSSYAPPQETGYMYNSWFGKFHLEMHWWHAAHFPLWGRGELLEQSLDWYKSILPLAQKLAENQGYRGARWPKQVGPDGKQSPSPIAPALIWQQPHCIYLAELFYRENPSHETLERWSEIIKETAEFMVSFAVWDEEKGAFVLGPPLIPAQENHKPEDSLNPPFELEYWKFGLELASEWMKRLEKKSNPKWLEVADALAKPTHSDGVYLAHENCPDTFENYNHDHPSMVAALGILPGKLIDEEAMRNTIKKVNEVWDWQSAWGWDFPMCAMTAARLGEPEMAVDFLLMEVTKNTYLANGHNYQGPSLTAYLPGNGGLLTAVAMMASGWHGHSEEHAPGFPKDGTWSVKWEGLHPIL
ncbi:glycoside hydrolase family 65 [Bacillus sinesaloumensis]|uniref:glycoside hydrolase family 65 n=1 Tax=Litchfieldia sinesaloumensis TaxID=1926280 RepID=UPI0009883D84|nr:glycoside hydrolase family 65 [Bacillus sinesaloumensis]